MIKHTEKKLYYEKEQEYLSERKKNVEQENKHFTFPGLQETVAKI